MIRALSYDGTGYWLMTKRLSRGKFKHWPSGQCALSATSARELRQIISGEPRQSPDSHRDDPVEHGLQNQPESSMVKSRSPI